MAIDDRVPLPDGFRQLEDPEVALLQALFPAAVDEALADQAANAVIRVWREDPSHWDASVLTFGAQASTFRRRGPLLYHYSDVDSELVSGEVFMRDDGFIDYICFAKAVDVTDLPDGGTEWDAGVQNRAAALQVDPPGAIAEITLEGPFEAEDHIHE